MDVDNAVCIVTGASSGIGAATARLLASGGAHVVLAARRLDRLESLARDLPGSMAVQTDVTIADQVERLMERVHSAYGTLDVVVNNAGQGLHVPLEQLRSDDFEAVLALNVVAPLVVMQAALPMLRSGGGGSIVNVSSLTSLRAFPGLGGYAATKSALNMISRIARLEWAASGVTVSTVYPSVTATEFHDRLRAGHIVTGPWSAAPDSPDLVAAAILFAVQHGDEHVLVADHPRAFQFTGYQDVQPFSGSGSNSSVATEEANARSSETSDDRD